MCFSVGSEIVEQWSQSPVSKLLGKVICSQSVDKNLIVRYEIDLLEIQWLVYVPKRRIEAGTSFHY